MNIPNALTTLRFLLIGVFLYFFWGPHNYLAACIVYVVAGITDLLDGWIARKFDMITDIGKLIDPLADKLMLIAALVSFWLDGRIPLAILAIVVIKELLTVIGGLYLYRKKIVVYADWIGKIATAAFTVGVILTFFSDKVYPLNLVFLYIAVALAVAALVYYAIRNFFKYLQDRRKAQ